GAAGVDSRCSPCSCRRRAAEPRAHATRLTSLARRIGARRNVAMWVSELWRYPVKSMAGEPMHTVLLGPDGIDGDRLLHVRDGRARVVTARPRPGLLGLHAGLGAGGERLVGDRAWADPWVSHAVEAAAGDGARLVRSGGVEGFDILPLLVATDGAVAAFGHDRRRLRPNVVI